MVVVVKKEVRKGIAIDINHYTTQSQKMHTSKRPLEKALYWGEKGQLTVHAAKYKRCTT